jgi:phosphoglycerate dehydrogenase-like enzyme
MMQIYAMGPFTDQHRRQLVRLAGADPIHMHPDPEPQAPPPAEFLCSEVSFGGPPVSWFEADSSLRWHQIDSVGFGEYEHLDWNRLGERLTVTNMAGLFTRPVAESALAGMLALLRGVDRCIDLARDRDWQKDALRADIRLLEGSKVLFLGYGSIARRLAELLRPFDCQITTFARSSPDADLHSPGDLDDAIRSADIVVATLPETSATRNLLDSRRLDLLGSRSLLISLGRGAVVDEEALVQRLTDGRIGGAVLDVTVDEPLPRDNPLWSCPNTILTQHTAGGTEDEFDRKIAFFAANLARYRAGEQLESVVDWEKGY